MFVIKELLQHVRCVIDSVFSSLLHEILLCGEEGWSWVCFFGVWGGGGVRGKGQGHLLSHLSGDFQNYFAISVYFSFIWLHL